MCGEGRGGSCSIPAREASSRTISHSTFAVIPVPPTRPVPCIERKSVASVAPLAGFHSSITSFTHLGDDPLLLPQLDGIDAQRQQFTSPQSARDEHGVIPLAAKRTPLHAGEQSLALLGCQPVSHPNSNPAHPLDASNPGGQFWTEQAGVGGLKSNSSDRCQPEVNGRGRILLLLKIESLAQNRGAVECETWFRAVPVDEVGYGTVISTLAAFGNEAIQDGGVRLFRIGKCQDPLGRSFLPTLF